MDNTAVEFPIGRAGVEYIGPFESYAVVVDGWKVPLLDAEMERGGIVRLVLDDRFSVSLSVAEADRVVPFIAQVVAVSLGFQSHPQGEDEPIIAKQPRPTRLVEVAMPPDQPQSDSA